MYSSKLSISRRFSMSVAWNILCILPCSISLMFTTLLKNQVECIFLAPLNCQHLQASCWFSCDILSLTKSLSENFKLVSSWDLVPIFLLLYINDCSCMQHLNLTITLSDLFIWWQACESSGTTLTPAVTVLYKYYPPKHLHELPQEQGSIQLSLVYYIES